MGALPTIKHCSLELAAGRSPSPAGSLRRELEQLGYAAVLYPVTLLRVATKAIEGALAHVAAYGTQAALLPQMQTRQQLYDLLGYTEYQQRDQRYFGEGFD